ncbi:hypothetical protein HMPREF1548_05141 [Clostridium sp. KLE 1755]|nr:hypothetical protein HMPREF1548_05141 [Clostridium sp. KLE 1755]
MIYTGCISFTVMFLLYFHGLASSQRLSVQKFRITAAHAA